MNAITRTIAALMLAAPIAAAQPTPPDAPLGGPELKSPDAARDMNEVRDLLAARIEQLDRLKATLEQTLAEIDAGREIPEPVLDRLLRSRDRAFGMDDDGPQERTDERRFRDRGDRDDAPRDRGFRRGRDDDRRSREPITDAQRAQVLAYLKEHDPGMLERHNRTAERNPELAERLFQRHAHRALEMIELKESNPKEYAERVERVNSYNEIREIIAKSIAAGTLDAPETRKEIESHILGQLSVRDKETQQEITSLASRLEDLRARREKAIAEKSEMVSKMTDRILNRAREFRDNPEARERR